MITAKTPDVSRPLHVPNLHELAKVIENGISGNYEKVSVSVVQCPELGSLLGCSGFGGKSAIVDVGGVNNMEYVDNNNKYHFDMKSIADQVGINGVIIGAAASKPYCSCTKDNSELMPCLNLTTNMNLTKEAFVDKVDGKAGLMPYPHSELSSLGNLFICEDVSGEDLIKIEASVRVGNLNFVTAIRQSILNHYTDKHQIGMGGYFVVKSGVVKSHIMPSFPPKDSPGDPSWLKFYEVQSPLICLSVFVTTDTHGDDLRLEHTHFWSLDNSTGGHYHTDLTPELVSYSGYYKPAHALWRIGKAIQPIQK